MAAIKHGEVGSVMFANLGNHFEGGLERHDIFLITAIVLAVSALLHRVLEEPVRAGIVVRWRRRIDSSQAGITSWIRSLPIEDYTPCTGGLGEARGHRASLTPGIDS